MPTPEPVVFAQGTVPADTEELTLVLQEGETALLDRLPSLRRINAEGSICYEELCAWAKAHPETELRYTVPLPGLGPTESGRKELDLRSLSFREAEAAAPLLNAVIYRFEFDARSRTAHLGVDFTLRRSGGGRIVRADVSEPVAKWDSGAARAAAMNRCAARAVAELAGALK